jgi:hypothetical protein
MPDFPVQIPDQSLTTVFETCGFTDIPRGQAFISKVLLPQGSTSVTATMTPYTWSYSSSGVEETAGTPQSLTVKPAGGSQYQASLPPFKDPEACLVEWDWLDEDGNECLFQEGYSARYFMPSYQKLTPALKDMCQTVLNSWCMLADNAYGNSKPNLAENLQIKFSLETVAEAMKRAFMSFQVPISVGSNNLSGFPLNKWGGLLYKATLRELTEDVLRGYSETPVMTGGNNIPDIDRSRYYDRWRDEFDRLDHDYQDLLKHYRNYYKNFNSGIALVGGGMYGASGPLLSNQAWNGLYNGQVVNAFRPVTMNFNLQ